MDTEGDVILQRILAVLIDSLMTGVIVFFFLTFTGTLSGSKESNILAFFIMVFTVLAFILLYAILLEGYWGQTIGKKVMGIVVVKEDGSPCTYEASIIRNLLRFVDFSPQLYIVGFISIAMSDKGQRIGDRLANTVVVKTER